MTETSETKRDIISPEGVEERLLREIIFYTTLTGGGKYRNYYKFENKTPQTTGVYDNLEESEKALATDMMLLGGVKIAPGKVIDIILGKKETP